MCTHILYRLEIKFLSGYHWAKSPNLDFKGIAEILKFGFKCKLAITEVR